MNLALLFNAHKAYSTKIMQYCQYLVEEQVKEKELENRSHRDDNCIFADAATDDIFCVLIIHRLNSLRENTTIEVQGNSDFHAASSNRCSIRDTNGWLNSAPLAVRVPVAFKTSQMVFNVAPDFRSGRITPATF